MNGSIMANARRFLSLLSLTLISRFVLSLDRIRQAINEGNMFTILRRRVITIIRDISARMSNAMSVSSFSRVTHILQEGGDPVAEISLDGDLAVLGAASDTAFHLEGATKLCKVV